SHLDLEIEAIFEEKILRGTAVLKLNRKQETDKLILDTRELKIVKIIDAATRKELKFSLGEMNDTFGQPLEITLAPETESIAIVYETSPTAAALQWLTPQQTAGKV